MTSLFSPQDIPVEVSFDQDAGRLSAPARGPTANPAPSAPISTSSTQTTTAPADPRDLQALVIEIEIDRQTRKLRCTQDDVMGLVGLSYLAGGFDQVIKARDAIERKIGRLQDTSRSIAGSRSEFLSQYDDLKERAQPPQNLLDIYEHAKPIYDKDLATANADLRKAEAAHPHFHEFFRKAWNTLAAVEDSLLRTYDERVLKSFKALAEENRKTAEKEWDRYAPVDAQGQALPFSDARESDVKGLAFSDDVLAQLTEGKKLGQTKPATRETAVAAALDVLWEKALKLADRCKDVRVALLLKQDASKDSSKKVESAQKSASLKDVLKNWSEERKKVGEAYPALLQVYPLLARMRDANDVRRRMGLEIAFALLRVRDVAKDVEKQAVTIWDTASALRVVPQPGAPGSAYVIANADLARPIAKSTYVNRQEKEIEQVTRLGQVLRENHVQAATQFGLTIPASEIAAQMLEKNSDLTNRIGWLHAPVVNSHLLRASEKDDELAQYFRSGELAHAAVSHVLDRVAKVKEHKKKWESRGLMLLWGAAGALAIFTDGASLYAAGAVQAAVSANEIFETVAEYQRASALAGMSLAAIEEAAWTRPALVKVVRTIVADSADIVQSAIGAKEVSVAVDLALMALSMLRPEEAPPARGPK